MSGGAVFGPRGPLDLPTVDTCPDAFTIEQFNSFGVKAGEYKVLEATMRRRFATGPAYWWDCVYLHPTTKAEAYLVKFDIVPPVPGQIASGDCGKKSDNPLRSEKRYLDVHGGPRAFNAHAAGGDEALLLHALRLAETQGVGEPCAGTGGASSTTTTRTVTTPKPGASATVSVPVKEQSTQATATFSWDEAVDLGVAFVEKARKPSPADAARLERLEKVRDRLEANCTVLAVLLQEPETPVDLEDFAEAPKTGAAALAKLCLQEVSRLQQRIDASGKKRSRAVSSVTAEKPTCLLFTLRLRSEIRAGRPRTSVVDRRASPLLSVGCKPTSSGAVLTMKRRRSYRLTDALGTTLRLTLARSREAEPAPGSKLKITFAQR